MDTLVSYLEQLVETPSAFRAWLDEQPPDGTKNPDSCADCFLHAFLSDCIQRHPAAGQVARVWVDTRAFCLFDRLLCRTSRNWPGWACDFQERALGWGRERRVGWNAPFPRITFSAALELLGEVME